MSTKIYTKTGDKGTTSLIGGTKVSKSHIRIESYGTIDELNSWIGVLADHTTDLNTKNVLKEIQDRLFTIGSSLACDPEKEPQLKLPDLKENDVEFLEKEIDLMNQLLEPMKSFILPGGAPVVSFAHVSRCVCRRAERICVAMQFECYFFVADWHSLTTHPDTKELKNSVLRVVAENIAAGIDPNKACLYVQSSVPEIAELYLLLNMLAYKGELEKTATFKDKVRQQPENVNAGLLTYPVLQAADILIHRSKYVPVGKDQEQHLEMARNFAQRFNYRYGEVFPEPQAFNYGSDLIKVPSLDGTGKMSKSENQMVTLYLADDDDLIRKKVMKAKTDAGPTEPDTEMPDYIKNLFLLMELVSDDSTSTQFQQQFKNASIRYGDMKKVLADDMVKFIAPIRERAKELLDDSHSLQKIIKDGTEKARISAQNTLEAVREKVGVNYF